MIDLPPDPPAAVAPCEARILDYRTWREAPRQSWHFSRARAGGGAVTLFGAEHLRDPAAPQFAAIAAAFAAARPTLVWFEGPDRGGAASADEAIRTQGESGYLRFLAAQAGLAARSFEPGPADQIVALKGRFPDDHIVLFFVLREAARLRDREDRTGIELDVAVTALLAKVGGMAIKLGLASSITGLPSLDAAARRVWPDRDWRTLPAAWFAPGAGVKQAKFLPAINTAVSAARDAHLFRLASEAATRGERVFVVVGRNHVPMIAPALACALAK